MTSRIREKLLGYLLGSLEAFEVREVEQELELNPHLQKELENMRLRLEPLASYREHAPPSSLAAKTCDVVFAADQQEPKFRVIGQAIAEADVLTTAPLAERSASRIATTTKSVDDSSSINREAAESTAWRITDLGVAFTIALAAAAVLFPLLHQSRMRSMRLACADNLRVVGHALDEFAALHQDSYPQVPATGNRSVAGIYAPILLDERHLTNYKKLLCPSSTLASEENWMVPTLNQIDEAQGPRLKQLQQWMGGSYGYSLGYFDDGELRMRAREGNPHLPVMSDSPDTENPTLVSLNHAGRGQNVLFDDNHVRYVTSFKVSLDSDDAPQEDDIFRNRLGVIAAGIDAQDFVIGASGTSPIVSE